MGISELTCERIRMLHKRFGYTCEELAETFGLRVGTVRVIVYR